MFRLLDIVYYLWNFVLTHNIHLGHHISISEPSIFIDFAIRFYFEVWNLQPRFPVPLGNILAWISLWLIAYHRSLNNLKVGTHCIEELLIHLEGRYYFFKAILKVMVTDHLSPNYNDLRYLWLGYLIDWLEILFEEAFLFLCKVHVFWEGRKILRNLLLTYSRQK